MNRVAGVMLVLMVLVVAAGGWLYWFITQHGFSARAKPMRLEEFLARRVRGLASPPHAKHLKNPLVASPLLIAEGRDHFADHCAICHANDGSGRTMVNDGLYPPAPDLRAEATQTLTDGEILYTIKNGVRFTGMPGWGGEDDDEENWKLVLFIRHLPGLTAKEEELMKEINGLGTDDEHGATHHEH